MCKAREHERSFNAILIILFVRRCARRAWLSRAIPRRGTRRGGGGSREKRRSRACRNYPRQIIRSLLEVRKSPCSIVVTFIAKKRLGVVRNRRG